jgi:DNA gyrase subunit B
MAKKEAIIEKKSQRWHSRNRVELTFGSNSIEGLKTHTYKDKELVFSEFQFHQAKNKAIEEIIDNSIDEYLRGNVKHIKVTLSEDRETITIEDDGIGFDVSKIVPVYSEYRVGSKFGDNESDENGYLSRTLGQNGVGSSATCLTSDLFEVTVRHKSKKKEKTVVFVDGANKIKEKRTKKFSGKSGVKITLKLSPEVYGDALLDESYIRKRIIDLSYINPGLKFTFNKEVFFTKKGLEELIPLLPSHKGNYLVKRYQHTYVTKDSKKKPVKGLIDLDILTFFNKKSAEREEFISFVNSTPTFDGGYHHDKVRRFFINSIKDKLKKEAKRQKIDISDLDICMGMVFVINLVIPNARFESQTKRKMVKHSFLEKAIESAMGESMSLFFRRNKDFLEQVIERAKKRKQQDFLKEASKLAKKSRKKKVAKLLDANARKDRSKCQLFICEGDSAIAGLRSSRDQETQGGIPLKGKPLNVLSCDIKDVIKNQEYQDIISAIGLDLSKSSDREEMRFPEIVFLADSDVDGGHINTLLINFFFKFWPELFKNGQVKLAKAPLYELETNKGLLFCSTDSELEKLKSKKSLKIKRINRNKGLGEMSREAWDYLMKETEYQTLLIDDESEIQKVLSICFSKDSGPRKELFRNGVDSI